MDVRWSGQVDFGCGHEPYGAGSAMPFIIFVLRFYIPMCCWMAPQLFGLQLARELGIPTVASFHNFLDPRVQPEKLNKLKKAGYWTLLGRRVFEQADVHHVVTAKEEAHIRAFLP